MTSRNEPGTTIAGRRIVLVALGKTVLAVIALLLVYFQLPLRGGEHVLVGMALVIAGLVVFGIIFVRQVKQIRSAEYPVLRAVEGISLVGCIFCVIVASVHYGIWLADPQSYSEPLNRLDALYFTVTTLATVGFGDITPTSMLSRSVTTIQMVLGVALLGAGVRVLLSVAQAAKEERRRDAPQAGAGAGPAPQG